MPGVAFDIPGETEELVLEPFTDAERGFSGLSPAGWQELAPANLSRGSSTRDLTFLVLEASQSTASELMTALSSNWSLIRSSSPSPRRRSATSPGTYMLSSVAGISRIWR